MLPCVRKWFAWAALVLCLAVAPSAAMVQPPSRVAVVGVLHPAPAGTRGETLSRQALEQGLKELGWAPGQTVRIEYRYATTPEQLDEMARDLVGSRPDVIVARSSPAIGVAKRLTTSIPIVMSATGSDPVELGFVASLARPGGNVTGLTLLNQELLGKHVELLKEAVPRLSRVAVLGRTASPVPRGARQSLDAVARALGVDLNPVNVRRAEDLEPAFAEIVKRRVGGLVVRADPFVLETHVDQLIALANRHRPPAIYWLSRYTEAGGLMSYGADLVEVHRRSAYFVDRILKGARPADLPIEEPTKFTLIVNLKTARTLGLTIPPSVLARASEVIQ